jgi:arginase
MTAARKREIVPAASKETSDSFRYLTAASRLVSIQAGLGAGQQKYGVEEAPLRIVSCGFESRLLSAGWDFETDDPLERQGAPSPVSQIPHQRGQSKQTQSFHNAGALAQALREVSRRTARHAWLRDFTLTLGGDHSVAAGSIHGLAQAWDGLGVIWVDAHADFNTPSSSPSGNFHGMPLAALCGAFELNQERGFEWFQPCLTPADVVLVGVRDIDPVESGLLAAAGVLAFSAEDVAKRGMATVTEQAMAHLLFRGERPLHLSFDIDALDASLVPGTGTPVSGGLCLDEAETLCRQVRQSGLLVGMDLVEVNPRLEEPSHFENHEGERTLTCARALILAALGRGPSR